MSQQSNLTCPPPFLTASEHPYTRGYSPGRFCGTIADDLSCCLPCPLEQWVYTDDFTRNLKIAAWLNIPALVCQCFLLLTFIALPEDVSHRHYLSVGLCCCLILCELAFIVPLGSKPDSCYDEVTPNDMYTNMSCAWTGALMIAGTLGLVVWVLLRSLWTHLRVCWDIHNKKLFFWMSQILGWGLPGLFLALCIPIIGVSYRAGKTCEPNNQYAFVTWFGWLIAFGGLGALLQAITTVFCIYLYLRDLIKGGSPDTSAMGSRRGGKTPPSTLPGSEKKIAWKRVKRVLKAQWRSILLSLLVIIEVVFFGVVFVQQNGKAVSSLSADQLSELTQWGLCLIVNQGDKNQCERLTKILGLSEKTLVATFYMAGLIGICTFALMARRSMFTGWWQLIRNPRSMLHRRSIGEDLFLFPAPKRKSFGRPLESEKHLNLTSQEPLPDFDDPRLSPISPIWPMSPGILPEPTPGSRNPSIPQPGDVTRRHETISWFDEREEDDMLRADARRVSKLDDIA